MARVATLVKALRTLARHPQSLARVIDLEAEMMHRVASVHGLERGLRTIDLLDLFPNLDETVEPYSYLEGTSLPTDLVLLKGLARRYPRCQYLEIGTWRGESVANVASVAEHCFSVSLSAAEMRKLGLSESFVANHRAFSRALKNVTYIEHDSHTYDFSSLQGKLDLVFIDGDHSYLGVKSDTATAFGLLRDPTSAIVWHDYGMGPETVRWTVLAGILDGCPAARRAHLYHVSNTQCAVYLPGTFRTTMTEFPQLPNKSFAVRLSAAPW